MFNFETGSAEADVDDNGLMSEDILQDDDSESGESTNSKKNELGQSIEYDEEKENEEDDGKVDHDSFNDVDEI